MLEWEVSAFLLSVHSCIPDTCQGLHCCCIALGSCVYCKAGGGRCAGWEPGVTCSTCMDWTCLPRIWEQDPGAGCVLSHNPAVMQSSDFVGVLFNPHSGSLMNLFSVTSPQLNTVPFIIIVCLQSCSQFSIPVLCLPLPKSFWINFSIRISWDTDAVPKSRKWPPLCSFRPLSL